MKKCNLFIVFLLLLVGCKNSFVINNSELDTSKENILPNGIVLSAEKELELLEFTKAFNLKTGYRTLDENDSTGIEDEVLEEFIKALKEKYGDEAELYYGDELIYSEEKEIPCIFDEESNSFIPLNANISSRNISSINSYYVIKSNYSYDKHWGLWWQYYTYTVNLYVESVYTTEKYNLKTDKAYYEYRDSVTNKSGWVDWTKFDNPYQNGYPTGNSNSDIAKQLEWAVAEANRGIIEIRGNTKYGWLPKVTNRSLYIIWYDDFIRDGSFAASY